MSTSNAETTVTVKNGFYRGSVGVILYRNLHGEYAVLFPGYVRPVSFPAMMLEAV